MDAKKNSRRAFLQRWRPEKKTEEEPIKMMTPDGKLVIVNKSAIKSITNPKVTNRDLKKWIDQKDK